MHEHICAEEDHEFRDDYDADGNLLRAPATKVALRYSCLEFRAKPPLYFY